MGRNKFTEVKNKIMGLKICPSCGSKNLIRVDYDSICGSCTWNSFSMSVNSGELDDFISEFDESESHRKSYDTKDVAS